MYPRFALCSSTWQLIGGFGEKCCQADGSWPASRLENAIPQDNVPMSMSMCDLGTDRARIIVIEDRIAMSWV